MSLLKKSKKSSPSRGITSLRGWVDNFFQDEGMFPKSFFGDWNKELSIPAVNVQETDKLFKLEIATPGMKKEDLKVSVEEGVLQVSAEKENKAEETKDDYTRKEFNYQSFKRSFWLPENVDLNTIKASYDDGVLNIVLIKLEVEKTPTEKRIEIK